MPPKKVQPPANLSPGQGGEQPIPDAERNVSASGQVPAQQTALAPPAASTPALDPAQQAASDEAPAHFSTQQVASDLASAQRSTLAQAASASASALAASPSAHLQYPPLTAAQQGTINFSASAFSQLLDPAPSQQPSQHHAPKSPARATAAPQAAPFPSDPSATFRQSPAARPSALLAQMQGRTHPSASAYDPDVQFVQHIPDSREHRPGIRAPPSAENLSDAGRSIGDNGQQQRQLIRPAINKTFTHHILHGNSFPYTQRGEKFYQQQLEDSGQRRKNGSFEPVIKLKVRTSVPMPSATTGPTVDEGSGAPRYITAPNALRRPPSPQQPSTTAPAPRSIGVPGVARRPSSPQQPAAQKARQHDAQQQPPAEHFLPPARQSLPEERLDRHESRASLDVCCGHLECDLLPSDQCSFDLAHGNHHQPMQASQPQPQLAHQSLRQFVGLPPPSVAHVEAGNQQYGAPESVRSLISGSMSQPVHTGQRAEGPNDDPSAPAHSPSDFATSDATRAFDPARSVTGFTQDPRAQPSPYPSLHPGLPDFEGVLFSTSDNPDAMKVMVMIDASAIFDMINPTVANAISLELTDDPWFRNDAPVVLARLRLPNATSPHAPVRAARPEPGRPFQRCPFFEAAIPLRVTDQVENEYNMDGNGAYDIVICERTARFWGFGHLIELHKLGQLAAITTAYDLSRPQQQPLQDHVSQHQQRQPPPPFHVPVQQTPATRAVRRPAWDDICRGYEGDRCACCGDRIDTDPHDPRSCQRRPSLYPARTTEEERFLAHLDADDRQSRLAQRHRPPSPIARTPAPPTSRPPATVTALAHPPAAHRPIASSQPNAAAFDRHGSLSQPQPQARSMMGDPYRSLGGAIPPSPSQGGDQAASEARFLALERSQSSMQNVLADLHADMRARQSHHSRFAPQAGGGVAPQAGGSMATSPGRRHLHDHADRFLHHTAVPDNADRFLHHTAVSASPEHDVGTTGMQHYPVPSLDVLGNMEAFDGYVRQYQEYRSKAIDNRRTAVSLVHCFSDIIDDLADVFTSLSKRRARLCGGDFVLYNATMLNVLSDDAFIRLFRELCVGALLDRPTQIIAALSEVHCTLDDGAELPYVVKVIKEFRAKLKTIPPHSIIRCTDEQIRDAFLQAVFRHEYAARAPDYVHCGTWEDARAVLIQAATDQALHLRPRPPASSGTLRRQHDHAADPPPDGRTWEQRHNDLVASVDPIILDNLVPEDRSVGATWQARFNELSRRVRLTRQRLRAYVETADPSAAGRTSSAAAQTPRADSRPRPPEQQPASPPHAQAQRTRDPTPDRARSSSRTRFAEGNCYRCGREGHRANQCTETVDINGEKCLDRRARSASGGN